jgi:hypothetical protein
LAISQDSYALETLLFFVQPINDAPVVVLPPPLTHLHAWHTYQDDLSKVIVSVDTVDTLEDTPVSIEGTGKEGRGRRKEEGGRKKEEGRRKKEEEKRRKKKEEEACVIIISGAVV